jgi:hypothetical protein
MEANRVRIKANEVLEALDSLAILAESEANQSLSLERKQRYEAVAEFATHVYNLLQDHVTLYKPLPVLPKAWSEVA